MAGRGAEVGALVNAVSSLDARRATGQPARWRDPATGHDWPDTGLECAYCGKPLHPILVAAAERFHELCRPEPVKRWRLR